MAIDALNANAAYAASQRSQGLNATNGLGDQVERFTEVFENAENATREFAAGAIDPQGVVQAFAEAEMALQTAVTIRDRIVSAYQELLRMPL